MQAVLGHGKSLKGLRIVHVTQSRSYSGGLDWSNESKCWEARSSWHQMVCTRVIQVDVPWELLGCGT